MAAGRVHRMWPYAYPSKQSGSTGTLAREDGRPEDEGFALRISTSTVVMEDPALARPHTHLPPLARVLSVGWRASAWLALGCNQPWELYRERPFYPHSLAIGHCSNTDMCKTLHFLHHNRTLASGFPGTGRCMPDMVQLSVGRQVRLPGLWRCPSKRPRTRFNPGSLPEWTDFSLGTLTRTIQPYSRDPALTEESVF